MIAVTPTQSNILAAMRSFLLAVMPSDVEVVAAQPNRVAEVASTRFVMMSPPRFSRLSTNRDSYADAVFTATIAGAVMTVSAVASGFPGSIGVGISIFGVDVAADTVVTALGTGTGGVGTYTIDPPQTVSAETMAAGTASIQQAAEAVVQLDFHAADGTSGDLAQIVSTLLRDDFGVQQFANQSPRYDVMPLFADDPVQRPFMNDQQQAEWRWVLDAHLQANQVVVTPQQFAGMLALGMVEATCPAS